MLREHPELRGVNRLKVWDSLRGMRLALWDEDGRQLVSFAEARRSARRSRKRHARAPIGGTGGGSFAAHTASTASP